MGEGVECQVASSDVVGDHLSVRIQERIYV